MTAAHADWSALAGGTLVATDDDGTARDLALTAVSPLRESAGWTTYALTFRGDAGFPAEQRTYGLTGDGVHEPVFLVPIGRDADGITLEAVFARATEEEH